MTTVANDHPPEEARRLTAFLGQWRVEGTLRNGESQAAVFGRWKFEPAIDGWGVSGIMDTNIEGMGTFEESELIGLDTVGGQVHMISANKYTIRDHLGEWTREDQLKVRYKGTHGLSEITEEITLDFEGHDRIVARVIEHADGAVVMTTDLTLTRQS
jgi:hypothetical protein